jgi:carnitine O-acetyltransferase
MAGEGIDRLLFGMKVAAMENGQEMPEIFKDPAYREAMRFRISTSQVIIQEFRLALFEE